MADRRIRSSSWFSARPDLVVGALILAVNAALCLRISQLSPQRFTPDRNEQTVLGGLFFLFWAAVFFLAARPPGESVVLEFLNRRQNAWLLSLIFGVGGIVLLMFGLGVFS